MLRAEIEYMNRKYRGFKKAQNNAQEDGQVEMASWWLGKAQMIRDIMSDLGYTFRNGEFTKREERAMRFIVIPVYSQKANEDGSFNEKKAPQVQAEERVLETISEKPFTSTVQN